MNINKSDYANKEWCTQCTYFTECMWFIGRHPLDKPCDWEPSRFKQKDDKDEQAPTGAGAKQSEDGAPAHFAALSLSELAAFLHTCGILPSGQGRDRGDGEQR